MRTFLATIRILGASGVVLASAAHSDPAFEIHEIAPAKIDHSQFTGEWVFGYARIGTVLPKPNCDAPAKLYIFLSVRDISGTHNATIDGIAPAAEDQTAAWRLNLYLDRRPFSPKDPSRISARIDGVIVCALHAAQ